MSDHAGPKEQATPRPQPRSYPGTAGWLGTTRAAASSVAIDPAGLEDAGGFTCAAVARSRCFHATRSSVPARRPASYPHEFRRRSDGAGLAGCAG
jgi:hypothetical protein